MMRPEIPAQRQRCAACDYDCGPVTYTLTRTPARDDEWPVHLCSSSCLAAWGEAEQDADDARARENTRTLARRLGVVR